MKKNLTQKELDFFKRATGQICDHIDGKAFEKPVNKTIVNDLQRLKAAAKMAGFDLQIASGFRDFNRQLLIWNEKVMGLRPVLDENENKIDATYFLKNMSIKEKVFTLLQWSAIPGCSRHHWGTDIDVYDANVFKGEENLQLTLAECMHDGILGNFHRWLTIYLQEENKLFFRPYCNMHIVEGNILLKAKKCAIATEPWHLSHCKKAKEIESFLNKNALKNFIISSNILLKEEIVKNFDDIYTSYIRVDC